ncbi:ATP-binding protein [Acidovorax sp. FG27]|uniref:ATP-binding protein n=1 Tax=Acidovorax sp. FG27 TaxID=3133652 RepID=UPI0030E97DAD
MPDAPTPRDGPGLAWQFGLLLLGALVASHLISMALLQRTGALIHPVSREQALALLVASHALAADRAQQLEPLQRQQPASPALPVWQTDTPAVAPFAMQPEEQRLAGELRQRLALPPTAGVWLQLERASGEDARAGLWSLAAWKPLHLRASLELPATGPAPAGWMNADLRLQGRYDWSSTLLHALPASVLPVLAAGLWLAWRLVRPLRELMGAAARVDYGRAQPPLPLHGPREARELTRQFNAMQQRIARHRDARTQLLAAISHDLRTPVTELRLQSELVDDPALRAGLLESVAELEALVSSTLDFARADARAEPAAPTDIAALLQALALRYRRQGHAVAVRACPPGLAWTCRPLALRRALVNLVDNALRHAGTPVELAAQVDPAPTANGEGRGGTLTLVVEDSGPGIPPAALERVLEPFGQLDAARGPGRGGVGLGLAIAQQCLHSQGGTLVLDNRPESGLRATLRLPQGAAQAGGSAPEHS